MFPYIKICNDQTLTTLCKTLLLSSIPNFCYFMAAGLKSVGDFRLFNGGCLKSLKGFNAKARQLSFVLNAIGALTNAILECYFTLFKVQNRIPFCSLIRKRLLSLTMGTQERCSERDLFTFRLLFFALLCKFNVPEIISP